MKIPAVLLLVSFGFISLSSMTHVEGRGLKETSRFTGRSNNEEREHPLSHNDMKVGTGHTVTVEREEDVVKPKTSYRGKHARNEINSSLSNNEYSKEDADDTSGGDDDDSSRTNSHHRLHQSRITAGMYPAPVQKFHE